MSWLSKLISRKKIEQTARIVTLGTSGAGKTTLIRYLETGKEVEQDPRTTLGIDVRHSPIEIGGWKLSAIDVGGQDLYRESLWGLGVSQADAVVYVIDGTVRASDDSAKFEQSKFAFDYMLNIIDEKTPILILINKQDLKEQNPLTVQEAVEQYDISKLVGRSFNIIPSSAKYGYGIEDAMNWLINKIEEVKK